MPFAKLFGLWFSFPKLDSPTAEPKQKIFFGRPPQKGRKESLMLNLTNLTAPVAENVISINGIEIGRLTDTDAQKVLDIVRGMMSGITQFSAVGTPVATPAMPTASATPVVYDHVDADFTDIAWHVKDNLVTYTHKDGKYMHEKAVRNVLNALVKASGATYDADAKAWVFRKGNNRDLAGAKAFVASATTTVTADEINAVRDKWTEKSAKKANKQ